jgi:hypothetical protein
MTPDSVASSSSAATSASVTAASVFLVTRSTRRTTRVEKVRTHTSGAATRDSRCMGAATIAAMRSGCPSPISLGTSSPMMSDR